MLPSAISRYVIVAMLGAAASASAQVAPTRAEVFKSPYCGCCEEWIKHLRKNGFDVVAKDVTDLPGARKRLGMPDQYGSCHTAKIGAYTIEGHVPEDDIKRLLKEKPNAVGLAAPSMPQGSPGMETSHPQPYNVLLVKADGTFTVFAKH